MSACGKCKSCTRNSPRCVFVFTVSVRKLFLKTCFGGGGFIVHIPNTFFLQLVLHTIKHFGGIREVANLFVHTPTAKKNYTTYNTHCLRFVWCPRLFAEGEFWRRRRRGEEHF